MMPPENASLEATVDELRARLGTMKDEIDALQIGMAERARPWYRQASTISTVIAVVALIFSVATTTSANRREERQNIQDKRTLLGQLIQRLDAMPRENANLTKDLGHDPVTLAQVAGNLNTENIALAGQAAELIESMPGHVTATEYLVVGNALNFSGLFDRAQAMFQAGASLATDQVTHTALLQNHAWLLAATGDLPTARAEMQEALNVFDKQPTKFKGQVLSINLTTQITWTSVELVARECGQARQHYDEALRLYNQLSEGVQKNQLRLQINALTQPVNQCAPAS